MKAFEKKGISHVLRNKDFLKKEALSETSLTLHANSQEGRQYEIVHTNVRGSCQ